MNTVVAAAPKALETTLQEFILAMLLSLLLWSFEADWNGQRDNLTSDVTISLGKCAESRKGNGLL